MPTSEWDYELSSMVFDGTNYVQTPIYLYNSENYQRPCQIEISLNNFSGGNDCVIFNSMLEKSPYVGMVFRITSGMLEMWYKSTRSGKLSATTTEITATFTRDSIGKWTCVSDYTAKSLDVISEIQSTPVPLTIGAGLNGNFQPWRYTQFYLNYFKFKWLD